MGSFFSVQRAKPEDHPLLQSISQPVNVISDYFTSELVDKDNKSECGEIKIQGLTDDFKYISEIKRDTYKVMDMFGRLYIVKRVTAQDSLRMTGEKPKEIEISNLIGDHPFCIKIPSYRTYKDIHYVIIPYAKYGPLTFSMEYKTTQTTVCSAIEMLYDIGRALQYLHAKHIVHRDVKPDNIVLSEEGYQLCDFNVSTKLQEDVPKLFDSVGTAPFKAAEICNPPYDPKPVDMFALGVTLFCLLYGSLPFEVEKDEKGSDRLLYKDIVLPEKPYVFDELKQIMLSLLSKDPEKRLTADELVKHKWLEERATSWKKFNESILNTPGHVQNKTH